MKIVLVFDTGERDRTWTADSLSEDGEPHLVLFDETGDEYHALPATFPMVSALESGRRTWRFTDDDIYNCGVPSSRFLVLAASEEIP